MWHNALAMESLYSVPPLRMGRVLCELRPEGLVSIAVEERGNLLRGAFGTLFRRLVCDPACSDAAHCPRNGTCPHELLFSPRWPAGTKVGLSSPPRAFLFRPPLDTDPCFTVSRPLRFELRLFGEAISTASLFLRTFQLLADSRVADRRMHLASAYALDWNGNPCAELVRAGQLTGEQPPALDFAGIFSKEDRPTSATIEFLSPTWLREQARDPRATLPALASPPVVRNYGAKSRDLRVPTFPALVCHIRDRISMLCRLYEGRQWQASFTAIGHAASQAVAGDWEGRWVTYPRISTRTGEEMPLAGFRGTVTCQGIDPRLWSLLRIGEEIHVGRQVVWGHGWFRVLNMETS